MADALRRRNDSNQHRADQEFAPDVDTIVPTVRWVAPLFTTCTPHGPRWVSRRRAASLFHSQRRLLVGPRPAPPRGATHHGHIFYGKLRPVHLHPGEHFPPRSPSFVYDLVVLTYNDPKEVIPARTSPLDAFPREIPQSGWSAFLFYCGRVP
jgi:hypothetical protein